MNDQKQHQLQEVKRDLTQYAKNGWGGALPDHVDPDYFSRVAITLVTQNPDLLQCSKSSLFGAFMTLAQLGLPPEGFLGQGYVVRYKNDAVAIPGYRGLMELARRSGSIRTIYAHTINENDAFDYRLGTNPELNHSVPLGDRGSIIGFYAVAVFKDDSTQFYVMSTEEVNKVRDQYSKAKSDYSPWKTNYEAMGLKTVVRRLCKWLPCSTKLQLAASIDESYEEGGKPVRLSPEGTILDITDPEPNSKEDMEAKLQNVDTSTGEVKPDDTDWKAEFTKFCNKLAAKTQRSLGAVEKAVEELYEGDYQSAVKAMMADMAKVAKQAGLIE